MATRGHSWAPQLPFSAPPWGHTPQHWPSCSLVGALCPSIVVPRPFLACPLPHLFSGLLTPVCFQSYPMSCSCCLKALSQQRHAWNTCHPLPHPWHFLSALCKPTSSPTPSQSSLTHLKNRYQCPVSHRCLPYTLQFIQPQTPLGNDLSLHTVPFKVPV